MATIELNQTPTPKQFDLKMPEGYDFSTKGTNWKAYKPYYLLRTDAVWEKSKLYQYFYTLFKSQLFFNKDNFYMISDTYMYYYITHRSFGNFTYDEIGDSGENHKVYDTYSNNGEVFQFDEEPYKNMPARTSTFYGDFSKEMTPLCMIKFFKWMRCNQKSEIKLSTVNGNTDPLLFQYDCFKEMSEMYDNCIIYHFKIMMELYYFRFNADYKKWKANHGLYKMNHHSRKPGQSRVLYY